jgi:putative ABC transport system ATP-binding protein
MRDVVKTYETAARALDGLPPGAGEFVAVTGPSGCGKSTLLHLIAALDRPDSGTVIVNGEDLATERDLNKHRARETGLVFQLDNLLPTLSASENVQVPMFEGTCAPRSDAKGDASPRDGGPHRRRKPASGTVGRRATARRDRPCAQLPGYWLMDELTGRLDQ